MSRGNKKLFIVTGFVAATIAAIALLEREQTDPVEFVADPRNGRAQTFPVMSGKSKLVVYTMNGSTPDLDSLPITRRALDIPAGETCVVALYPR